MLKKTSTKGRFPIPYKTNAGMWIKDREWKQLANKKMHNMEHSKEVADVDMLERRKKQKILQNTALEAQYKIVVKKPKF